MKFEFVVILLLAVALIPLCTAGGTGWNGAIWTTTASDIPQNENHYSNGEVVWVRGEGFDPYLTLTIRIVKVNPPDQDEVVYCAHVIRTDELGHFFVPTLRVAGSGKDGVYKVEVFREEEPENIKSDNLKAPGFAPAQGHIPGR